MRRLSTHAAWKEIDTLFEAGSLVGLTDRQLLDRFEAGEAAEAAFEALVERHGPMVRGVCRSMMGDLHEADDAFQATFLVLARRAGSIRRRDSVGSWLYGVACRVSARARADAARRRVLERYIAERSRLESSAPEPSREPMPEVLEEVERLPERYRAPIVLCYLEGQSQEQAAQVLGCPLRTVQTRLQRGKAKLRTRLVRRGLAPAVMLALGLDAAEAASVALGGALPSALSESTARASVQFAASRVAGLATMAVRLAQGVLRSLFWQRLGHAAGLASGLSLGLALAIFAIAAAGPKSDQPVTTIRGRVLDDAGRPIAGAEVWMPTSFDERPETTPHATADARGHYVLPVPEAWRRRPGHEWWGVVWAHAPGHRINTANVYAALTGLVEAVDLTLGPATDTSFVVLGPDGWPVAGAMVEPGQFKTPINAYLNLPRAMLPATRAVTDASGRARLPAMPREGFRSVRITAGALGSQALRLQDLATEPARREVRLRPVGRIEGRVIAERPEWTRGLKVYLTTIEPDEHGPGPQFQRTQGDDAITTGPDGRFVIAAIATGKLVIGTEVDASLPARPLAPEGLEVRANQITRVDLPLERAVRVRGTIRVKDTGEPVAGASVSIRYGWEGSRGEVKGGTVDSSKALSDANGRFEAYVLPGDVTVQVGSMPEPFIPLGQPGADRHRVPEKTETFDLPSIEVVRGITIEGRVVDAGDRPIKGLDVIGASEGQTYGFATTQAQGEFTIGPVPPGRKLSYKARVTDHDAPVDVEIVREEPLLLRAVVGTTPIAATPVGVGIHGTVVDREGRPVEGVQVNLIIEAGGTQRREPRTTDAHGVYRDAQPIVKGARYRAIVSPGKFVIASSATVTAEGRDPIIMSPITVVRLRTIAGRVVDTDGRPVAGARVLNWGNRAPLTDATTGPTGRFQLDGFPREKALIFVDAPGYRFHRATSDPGKSTTELTIRRDGQPPERGVASLGRPITRERALELAGTVLKPYADKMLKPGSDPEAQARVLEVLARIDPEGAWRKCQAGEKPWDGDAVRIAVVRQFIACRPEEAEAIVSTVESNYWRQSLRIELVDALLDEARDRKIALLNEAVLDAKRNAEGGRSIHHLIGATTRLIDLGRDVEARRAVDEALPLAKALDKTDPRLGGTRAIIGCLARLDLEAALALIPDQGDEGALNILRGLIARSVAATHPAESRRLIDAMSWNRSETYAARACRWMATVDLPRARRIAERIENDVLRGYTLGKMAEAVGAADLATARQIRTESYRAFNQAMERGMDGVWGARAVAVMAAALLPGVERTEPDRLAEGLDRVLSLRWYPRSVFDAMTTQPDTSGVEAMRGDSVLAAVLVRYDHELARSIARPIIDRLRTPLADFENHHFDRYAVLPTLALADPESVAELVEVIPDLKEESIGQSRDIARLIVAGAIAAPESQFWTIIRRSVIDLEFAERED